MYIAAYFTYSDKRECKIKAIHFLFLFYLTSSYLFSYISLPKQLYDVSFRYFQKYGNKSEKDLIFCWHERGTKKNSVFPTGIEPTTFRILVGCSEPLSCREFRGNTFFFILGFDYRPNSVAYMCSYCNPLTYYNRNSTDMYNLIHLYRNQQSLFVQPM